MPRAREYKSNAEKQAAYRQRHAARQPPLEAHLAGLARSLHRVLNGAVQDGHNQLPAELLGANSAQTMRNLINYIRGRDSCQINSRD